MDEAAESLKRGLRRSSARDIYGQARARLWRDQAPREILRASPGAVGGVDPSALLTAGSAGVFGLRDLSLSSTAPDAARGSVVTSTGKSVHLDQGTRLLLGLQAGASGETRGGREPDAAKPTGPKGSSTDKR